MHITKQTRCITVLLSLLAVLALLLVGCPAPQDPTDDPGTDPTPPPRPHTVTFAADFAVLGTEADALTAALAAAGIAVGEAGADKTIYAGEASAAIVTEAKALLTARQNHYSDYVILQKGEAIAVYAVSAHGMQAAITHLIERYAKDGGIQMEIGNEYVYEAPLSQALLGNQALDGFVVSYADGCAGIAANFAKELSVLCGKEILTRKAPFRGKTILLQTEQTGNKETVSDRYHLEMRGNALTVTADNRNTLSYAAYSLLADLAAGTSIAEGENRDAPIETKTYAATDTSVFKYCGTWQTTDADLPDTMISSWTIGYVEVSFSGNAITAHFARPTAFDYRIDEGEYATHSGGTQITFLAEGEGTHTLRIYKRASQKIFFDGVSVEEHMTLSRPAAREHYIQFVGDSITASDSSYHSLVAEALGWDYGVTARSGIAVRTERSWWYYDNYTLYHAFGVNIGMADAFFKAGMPNDYQYKYYPNENYSSLDALLKALAEKDYALAPTDQAEYEAAMERLAPLAEFWKSEEANLDLTEQGNTPDIVFLMLGTNDGLVKNATDIYPQFVERYVSFVEEILAFYGEDTEICIMQCLDREGLENDDTRFRAIREVANTLSERYAQVQLIDRDLFEDLEIEKSDGLHPTAEGHEVLAERLIAILSDYYQ